MKFISTFAGIGGFDLGFERAGMTCLAQVEKDKHARGVLARHWPDAPKFDDVRAFGRSSIDGTVDLICGGFPCQDLSLAGKRAGLAGERSGLFYEFMRIAGEFAPRWLVVENVPGLLSSNGGRDMGIVTKELVKLGYGIAWRTLDAKYFGVPQRRRRVFIVGCLGDARRAAEVLFESESLPGNAGAGGGEREDDAAHVGGCAGGGGGIAIAQRRGGYGYSEWVDGIAPTLQAGPHGGNDKNPFVFESRYFRNGRGAPSPIAPPLKAQNGGTGKGDGAPLVLWTQNQRNEIREMEVCGALQAQAGMKQSFYYGVRRLMPVEWERLQGFPDGWTAGQSDTQRYKQLGNAVAVPVAEWIGRRIMEAAVTK